jgi:hypothetical protein
VKRFTFAYSISSAIRCLPRQIFLAASLLLQDLPLEPRERGILRTLVLRQAACNLFLLVQETFYLYLNERIVSLQFLRISLCIITIISPCRKINGAIREKERPPLRRYFSRAKPGPFSQFLHAKKSP